ncbi:MAG: hypothetical protein JWP80_1662 [Pseudomonas sp.]|nr:hypothetical protein [Pseudomonas sp.]
MGASFTGVQKGDTAFNTCGSTLACEDAIKINIFGA